jgi:hypothetical protein
VSTSPAGGLLAILAQVPDPRGRQGIRHPLAAMLAAVICAVLSGARGCDAIADWVKVRGLAVWHLLGGTRKPPCSNCYRDLLAVLPPDVLEAVLCQWLDAASSDSSSSSALSAVQLDGKTLRGTLQTHVKAVHLLTAWDERHGGVLKQLACDSVGQEAQVAVMLIRQLLLKGKVVTADAAFCQREVCQAVLDQQGDYLLVVKDNQPQLKGALELEFTASGAAFSPSSTAAT